MPDTPDDPRLPLVTLSVLDVPITAQARCESTEIHLLLGGATVIFGADWAAAG